MKLAAFSDLHLPNHSNARTRGFRDLLRSFREGGQVTDLLLLGDIFDLLIGPFSFWRDVHAEIFSEIEAFVANGGRVVWLEGNHDFFFKDAFRDSGIEFHDEPFTLEVGRERKKIYLAHGDLANPDDRAYLRWRAFTRSPFFRLIFGSVPESLAKSAMIPLAERVSRKSRKRNSPPDYVASDPEMTEKLRALYRRFAEDRFKEGFRGVMLGHCHIVEEFRSNDGHFYVNLGSSFGPSLRYSLWDPDAEAFPKIETYRIIDS